MSAQQNLIERQAKLVFEGKTIERVDARSVNCWTFFFSDGTYATIDTEARGHGIYGPSVVEAGQQRDFELPLPQGKGILTSTSSA
jgi:hypothetical protein